ncbi:hypothetical protein VAEKB19_5180029 [Vibrio aestuarianus]|nr:hypothetical protein VAEKB19_5180029 [Vibrio aestuarianus]
MPNANNSTKPKSSKRQSETQLKQERQSLLEQLKLAFDRQRITVNE